DPETGDYVDGPLILTLALGQAFTADYQVTVEATAIDHAVSGAIEVHNPAPIDAVIDSVADVISTDIAAVVTCGVTFPYTLAAGETLECSYSAELPDDTDRTNTA